MSGLVWYGIESIEFLTNVLYVIIDTFHMHIFMNSTSVTYVMYGKCPWVNDINKRVDMVVIIMFVDFFVLYSVEQIWYLSSENQHHFTGP